MFKKVLVPVDVAVAQGTRSLLAAAKELSQNWDCELHVATVIPDFGMAIVGSYFEEGFEEKNRAAAAEQLEQVMAEVGIKATPHILAGTIYDSVIGLSNELGTDLIIIGAHQPDLRDYLLGSNAARVVRHSNKSVMVLRDI